MSETVLPFDGVNADRAIGVDASGSMTYSGASAEGRIEIEIPSLKGSPNPTESLHFADFGLTVASRVESAMNRQGYLKSGPQQNGPQVLKHYLAVARGAQLLDSDTLKRMESVSKEFSAEPEKEEYYAKVVRPWLQSLKPGKR